MSVIVVTGSSGLIGSETVRFFHEKGFDVVGIDNDMRSYFFGNSASTLWNVKLLEENLNRFKNFNVDIRNTDEINRIFRTYGRDTTVVVHAAAQPSHDWAAREPVTDFTINANGTLTLLEAMREHCRDASFVFTSTNKVYGDTPNTLPFVELDSRWELDESHRFFSEGVDETMSIDRSMHSLFGASKVAADVLVQEYGRYFEMNTVCFRGGCLTGPSHSGAQLHGFLSYLVQCAVTRKHYTIFGHKGKQVRDNIHSHDLINAFWEYCERPKTAAVYNIGGSRYSNCSVLEAISLVQEITGMEMDYTITNKERAGDHIWWISDLGRFKKDYPNWTLEYSLEKTVHEIAESVTARQRRDH